MWRRVAGGKYYIEDLSSPFLSGTAATQNDPRLFSDLNAVPLTDGMWIFRATSYKTFEWVEE